MRYKALGYRPDAYVPDTRKEHVRRVTAAHLAQLGARGIPVIPGVKALGIERTEGESEVACARSLVCIAAQALTPSTHPASEPPCVPAKVPGAFRNPVLPIILAGSSTRWLLVMIAVPRAIATDQEGLGALEQQGCTHYGGNYQRGVLHQ